MKFTQIPNIESTWDNVLFETLSPSTFSWVKNGCGYQVMLQKALASYAEPAIILPSNRNAIIGTIIHKIYELATKGEIKSFPELQHKWEELVANEKKKISDTYPTLRSADINDYVKRNQAFFYAMQMMQNANSVSKDNEKARNVLTERWLDCTSLGLRGIADKIIIGRDTFDIVDYKSGLVLDDAGNIKEEYRIQLHLYAAMCRIQSMGSPRNLCLIDIAGNYHYVPYDESFCRDLLCDVKTTLSRLNQTILSRDFQRYSKSDPSLCPNYVCRHVCKFRSIIPDSIYQTFTGLITAIPSTNMYLLQTETQSLYISGLDVYNVDNPYEYIGKTLTFVNVVRSSKISNDNSFKVTENTLIYEQL